MIKLYIPIFLIIPFLSIGQITNNNSECSLEIWKVQRVTTSEIEITEKRIVQPNGSEDISVLEFESISTNQNTYQTFLL